jgi:two-component system, NtrC family, sensor kinase
LNIFLNAIDALSESGHLRITTEFKEHNIILKITDTGCGIAKEDLSYIFDPFFTKKENGTGLGLSITRGIINEHGGRIFAESELGRGTTFRIELPIRKDG